MLRSFFLSLSRSTRIYQLINRWAVTRYASRRFVAGDKLSEAVDVASNLNKAGLLATLDFLGENTTHRQSAIQATQEILAALQAIHDNTLRSNVSIKLTQIGLLLDPSFCLQNLITILEKARSLDNFIRVDMEDSSIIDLTLKLCHQARQQGYQNLGVVLQAYLYRTSSDLLQMVEAGIPVRMCKGAYNEPPSVAYPEKGDVNSNYDVLARILVEHSAELAPEPVGTGRIPPLAAIATHDLKRIQYAQTVIKLLKLKPDSQRVEFQMLYGIRRDQVRVYVPYGTHWYPYFMRRLAERPANVWFFVSNFFRK
jgi:proline dehydrogenase